MNMLRSWWDWELVAWISGLAWLWMSNPETAGHWGLWWPGWVWGITSPGYNLGHSVAYLLDGNWQASWEAHWLGGVALIIISLRVIQLVRMKVMQRGGVINGKYYAVNA